MNGAARAAPDGWISEVECLSKKGRFQADKQSSNREQERLRVIIAINRSASYESGSEDQKQPALQVVTTIVLRKLTLRREQPAEPIAKVQNPKPPFRILPR